MKPTKQTFKRNTSIFAKEKLNKHRELCPDSPFSIIEVAQMLDVVHSKNSKETATQESIFFSVSLN